MLAQDVALNVASVINEKVLNQYFLRVQTNLGHTLRTRSGFQ